MLALGLAVEGALLLAALVLGRLTGADPFARFRLDLGGFAAGLAATLPLLAGLGWCLRTRWEPMVRLMRLVEDRVAPLFRGSSPVELAALALLAGVAEEALFRGVLQSWLAGLLPGWAAVLVAGTVFGLAHWLSPAYAVLAGAAGIYLGALLLAGGNLLVPVVAHAAYDLVALVLVARQPPATVGSE